MFISFFFLSIFSEPETPTSMVQLHDITDRPPGWIQLVKSLIKVVPRDHPMGPSVITLLLDDSPLPSKSSVMEVAEMISEIKCFPNAECDKESEEVIENEEGTIEQIKKLPKTDDKTPYERNLCVILGCLAEKLAGPSSISVLSETTLNYLVNNLTADDTPKDVILFSLIALEKFSQTSENKATIKRKLALLSENPLLLLEKYAESTDYVMRQVGFCAKWSLDNYFLVENRSYSYETVDVSNINVMLNTKDVSEYLKISSDGLEARCDSYSFESVRCTFEVRQGAWYYEVLIITPGVMQIGFATKQSSFLSNEGYGIGDDHFSISFDGCRRLVWYNAKSKSVSLPCWQGGSICGCYIDLDNREVIFSLDGVESAVLNQVFDYTRHYNSGFFAAASFMSFQQCRFNFGSEPFKYPPVNRKFNTFNSKAVLRDKDKIVLPRHLFLAELRRVSVREDSCTLCFDKKATIRIEPCKHRGFCSNCALLLTHCPLCRCEIRDTVQEILDSPIDTFDDCQSL